MNMRQLHQLGVKRGIITDSRVESQGSPESRAKGRQCHHAASEREIYLMHISDVH